MRVNIVPITEINEGSRRRQDYGALDELVESIKQKGLIQPIAVGLTENYDNPDDVDVDPNYPYILLAGGRRLSACKQAGLSALPVRIYDRKLSELELRSIELEENIQRKELTWKETLALEKEIHELQVAIHGRKISTSPDAEGHSLRDTAELLNKSHASISRDMSLLKAIEANPELPWDQCKNKHEATKLVKKVTGMIDTKVRSAQANKILQTGTRLAKKLSDSYIIRDCFEAMAEFPRETFHFAEVDPPYGIDLTKAKRDYNYDDYEEVKASEYVIFLNKICTELYRIMAQDSYIVFWFAPEPWFESVHRAIASAGFNVHRMVGIWSKGYGQTNSPETMLGNSYEMFFYASKGSPKLNRPGRINTFVHAPVAPQYKIHPAERPVELIRDILTTFAKPNSRVIVPFAGSGKTLIASALESMIPLGYDLVPEYKEKYTIQVQEQFNQPLTTELN